MSIEPVKQLTVWRTFGDGLKVEVGGLAQNRQGVFFQYNEAYLQQYPALSPFTLKTDSSVQLAPAQPHAGLHGVFADSLPDGWGLLLMDRVFRQHGMLPAQVTAMDRLASVACRLRRRSAATRRLSWLSRWRLAVLAVPAPRPSCTLLRGANGAAVPVRLLAMRPGW